MTHSSSLAVPGCENAHHINHIFGEGEGSRLHWNSETGRKVIGLSTQLISNLIRFSVCFIFQR